MNSPLYHSMYWMWPLCLVLLLASFYVLHVASLPCASTCKSLCLLSSLLIIMIRVLVLIIFPFIISPLSREKKIISPLRGQGLLVFASKVFVKKNKFYLQLQFKHVIFTENVLCFFYLVNVCHKFSY